MFYKFCFSWGFAPYNNSVEPSYMSGLSATERENFSGFRFVYVTFLLLPFLDDSLADSVDQDKLLQYVTPHLDLHCFRPLELEIVN